MQSSLRLLPTHVLTRAHKLWQHRMVINALGGALYYSVVLKVILFLPSARTNKKKIRMIVYSKRITEILNSDNANFISLHNSNTTLFNFHPSTYFFIRSPAKNITIRSTQSWKPKQSLQVCNTNNSSLSVANAYNERIINCTACYRL